MMIVQVTLSRSIGAGGLSINIRYESVTNGMRFRVESIIDMGGGGYRIGQLENSLSVKTRLLVQYSDKVL